MYYTSQVLKLYGSIKILDYGYKEYRYCSQINFLKEYNPFNLRLGQFQEKKSKQKSEFNSLGQTYIPEFEIKLILRETQKDYLPSFLGWTFSKIKRLSHRKRAPVVLARELLDITFNIDLPCTWFLCRNFPCRCS